MKGQMITGRALLFL